MKTLKRRALLGLLLGLVLATATACSHTKRKATEAMREANVQTLRDVIAQHHGDKGRYPERLEELIETGYLRKIPLDPLTRSAATWVPVYAQDPATGRQAIVDVRAGKVDWLDRLLTLF
jgi:general secretion pathway protein G